MRHSIRDSLHFRLEAGLNEEYRQTETVVFRARSAASEQVSRGDISIPGGLISIGTRFALPSGKDETGANEEGVCQQSDHCRATQAELKSIRERVPESLNRLVIVLQAVSC